MKIVVIGRGYVALSTATSLAVLGHNIVCVDDNVEIINSLSKAIPTINEQGFSELLARFVNNGQLQFTTNLVEAIQEADIIICGVVTQVNEVTGVADNTTILRLAEQIGENITSSILYISTSTIPLGTTRKVKSIVEEKLSARNLKIKFDIASLPEFLREGAAIESFLNPSKIVIGTDNTESYRTIHALLSPVVKGDTHIYATTVEEAELIKLSSNMLIATRISYMNTIAGVCERMGSEYSQVHHAIFGENMPIYAGAGYSGECFPKDIRTLIHGVEKLSADATLLKAVEEFNQTHKLQLYNRLRDHYLGNLCGKRIVIWGLSTKPGGDDIENTPSIAITELLIQDGCTIIVCDNKYASRKYKEKFPQDSVVISDNRMSALLNADALIILSNSSEFKEIDLKEVKTLMKTPLILDAKNLFNNKDIEEADIIYYKLFK